MRFRECLSACLVLFFLPLAVEAQQIGVGTSFWFAFPVNSSSSPLEDELIVTISSQTTNFGSIEIPGQSWSQNFYIQPHSSVEILLPDFFSEIETDQILENRGIHITTDQPATVQAFNYGAAAYDGTRILPENLLGTSYIIASYAGLTVGNGSIALVVAAHDNTEVEITPAVATSAGSAAGTPFIIQLNQGETYRIEAFNNGDLTGTRILSTDVSGECRPFAVFAGAGMARVPADCLTSGDFLFEQLYDVEKWGTTYAVAPLDFEIDPSLASITSPRYTYRIIAASNATSIAIDGASVGMLQAGQFLEFNQQENAHCIEASAPICVVQYMEGGTCGGNGDPAMVILDPLENSVSDATFSIVNSSIAEESYINLIIPSAGLGACWLDGTLIPIAQFSSAGTCADYWYCTRNLIPGEHTVQCSAGFAGVIFGTDNENYGGYAMGFTLDIHRIDSEWEQTLCTNQDAQISIPPNHTAPEWYYAEGDGQLLSESNPFIIQVPVQNAIYELHAENMISGCIDTFYYSVESPDAIPVTIVPNQQNVCSFEPVILTAETNQPNAIFTYEWSPHADIVNDNAAQIAVLSEDNADYTVTVTTPSGCAQGSATFTLDVNQGNLARFEVAEDYYQVCSGEMVSLEVEVEEVIWSDNFDPAISWGDWQAIDGGDESNLCGVVSGNALYFNGGFPREAITQPLDLSGGATVFFALKIANEDAPCDDAEPGDNVVLSYSVGGGAWTTIQTFLESAYPDFTTISVPLPAAACNPNTRLRWRQNGSYIANQDNWVLDNAFISHDVNSSLTYTWSPTTGLANETGTSVDATPSVTTWYEVTTIDPASGCDYIDSVLLEVGQPFTLTLPESILICSSQEVMLTAIPSQLGEYEFSWSPSATMQGSFSANPTVDVTQSETYTVEATSEFGCTAQGTVSVTLGASLELDITISDDSLCAGESAVLEATITGDANGIVYQWSGDASITNAASSQISVTPLGDAVITCVAMQEASGCEAEQSVSIDITPEFSISISPNDLQTCQATGTAIAASNTLNEPLQWSWQPSGWVQDPMASSTVLSTENSGVLTVTATSAAGCTSSNALNISIQPLLTNLGPDTGQCIDATHTLSVPWSSEYNVLWNTGATASSIEVNETGIYSVFVTAPDGCTSRDSVLVEFFDYPELDLGPDTSACVGEEIRFQAGQPGLEYLWNTGQLSREIYVTGSGEYSVEITNGYCISRDTAVVVFNPLPVQPFKPEYVYCFEASNESFFLDAQNQGGSYLWSNDSTSRILLVEQPGTYGVTIVSEYGCINEFQTVVNRECIEALFIPNSFTPDGDGVNDEWFIYGTNIVNYKLQIFNQWGELFFESTDMTIPWTGQRGDGEYYVDSQVFPYVITYQLVEDNGLLGTQRSVTGYVALIR